MRLPLPLVSTHVVAGTQELTTSLPDDGWLRTDHAVVSPDLELGAATRLSRRGAWLELGIPAARQPRAAATLALWVRAAPALQAGAAVVGEGEGTWRVTLTPTGVRIRRGAEEIDIQLADRSQWHHVALSWDAAKAEVLIFVDGRRIDTLRTAEGWLPFESTPTVLVRRPRSSAEDWLVGPIHLFAQALSGAELRAVAAADRAGHPSQAERHPLSFRLVDDDDDAVLHATDPDTPGRRLHIVLRNESAFSLDLDTGLSLILQFRPGALAVSHIQHIRSVDPAWSATAAPAEAGFVWVELRLQQELSLAPGGTTALTLDRVRGGSAVGAHGTQVELLYDHPFDSGLSCRRTRRLHIRSEAGRRKAPLRAGLLPPVNVITDGETRNRVRIYLANTSRVSSVWLRGSAATTPTKLVLAFEQGPRDAPWCLATADELAGTTLAAPPAWQVSLDTDGWTPVWTLMVEQDAELKPGEVVEFLLEGLVSRHMEGVAHATLQLYDVPGFWDTERALQIPKSRIRESVRSDDGVQVEISAPLRVGAEISDAVGPLLPAGMVMLWGGAPGSLPAGWLLCDGTLGTPNLTGMGPAPVGGSQLVYLMRMAP